MAAVRLINALLERAASPAREPETYPSWEALASVPQLASLRGMGGALGDLARKIQWGARDPLPAWRMHYVTGGTAYAFSLTDVSDPCRFTYFTNDSGAIIDGHPVEERRQGIVPITE